MDWSDDARCLDCDYPLRGLAAPRCPECGRPFDPADPTTVWLPRRLRLRRPPPVVHAAGDVGLVVVGLTTVGRWMAADGAVSLGWLLWWLLLLSLVGQQAGGVMDWVAGPAPAAAAVRRSRRWACGCLAAAVAFNVTWGSCPHAAWFDLGPIGLMRSPHGPCHNPGVPAGTRVAGQWYVF